ncbi:MAG: VacJ family lipoprotein [Pseudomonadota bacterium]|jgi:phospholipid-binding lipoprotein MlaA|nr:VacJ family lipoprotein [Pseudomonadota bacterium]
MGSNNRCCILVLLGWVVLISGCATTRTNNNDNADNDPIEGVNRVVYDINEGIDKYIFVPVAETYAEYIPQRVRNAVTNFFNNLLYLDTILNDFLQGKLKAGLEDSGRFIVNSTAGIGGLFDPATALGIPKREEDFGQTLGVWGAGEGAYVVLPFLGPNSVRDAPGVGVSTLLNPLFYISSIVTIPVGALGAVNERANFLEATRLRDEAALDSYVFTREAYRQKRLSEIYDGEIPIEELEEDVEEDVMDVDEESGEPDEGIEAGEDN